MQLTQTNRRRVCAHSPSGLIHQKAKTKIKYWAEKTKVKAYTFYHLTIYFENMSTRCYDNSLNVTYVDLFTVRTGSIETCNDFVLWIFVLDQVYGTPISPYVQNAV